MNNVLSYCSIFLEHIIDISYIALAVVLTRCIAVVLTRITTFFFRNANLTVSTSHSQHLHLPWYSHDGLIVLQMRKKVCSYPF